MRRRRAAHVHGMIYWYAVFKTRTIDAKIVRSTNAYADTEHKRASEAVIRIL